MRTCHVPNHNQWEEEVRGRTDLPPFPRRRRAPRAPAGVVAVAVVRFQNRPFGSFFFSARGGGRGRLLPFLPHPPLIRVAPGTPPYVLVGDPRVARRRRVNCEEPPGGRAYPLGSLPEPGRNQVRGGARGGTAERVRANPTAARSTRASKRRAGSRASTRDSQRRLDGRYTRLATGGGHRTRRDSCEEVF